MPLALLNYVSFPVTLFAIVFALPLKAAEIHQIRFGTQEGKTRMVLEVTDNPMQKISPLEGGAGLNVDVKASAPKAVLEPVKGALEKASHYKLNDDVHRIALHSKAPLKLNRHFFLPANDSNKHGRLVFDFETVGAPLKQDEPQYEALLEKAVTTTTASVPIPPDELHKIANRQAIALHKPVIVIDPGHGGKDSGAVGVGGTYEKKLVLRMSQELQQAINATGRYRAVLTRNDDRFIPLRQRVDIARKHKADLFISVHADSLPKASKHVSGATVYTLSETASDAESALLASRENKSDLIGGVDLKFENSEVSSILIDLVQRETMNLSAKYANMAISSLGNRINVKNHAHRFAGFAVLKGVDTPSILLEMGYLSNEKEEWKMNQASYRNKLASGMVESIDSFFRQQIALNSVR